MNKVKCLECGQILESKFRHDFQECSCPNRTFCDGGEDYQRVGGKDMMKIFVFKNQEKESENILSHKIWTL